MNRDFFILATIESSALLLAVWLVFQLLPSIPSNWKAWIWRFAFLKTIVGFVPMGSVLLHVLPPPSSDPDMSFPVAVARDVFDGADTKPMLSPRGKMIAPPPLSNGTDPLFVLWGVGAAATFAFGVFGRVRVAKIVRRAIPIENPAVREALSELMNNAGIVRPVRLLTTPDIDGAALLGGLRPTIVLPRADLDSDLRLMLAHEVAHLVRRDLFWFGTIWAVQALLFFNPIVWVAVRRARLDHESATDRDAVELADASVQTYADMLLRTTVASRMSLVPGALSMAESARNVQQRLQVMKNFHRSPSLWIKSVTFALALLAVASLPTYVPAAVLTRQDTGGKSQGHDSGFNNVHVHKQTITNLIVDLDFDRLDIHDALRMLFKQAHRAYKVDPRIKGTVTVSLRNVLFDMALANVVRQVDATVEIRKDVSYVVPAPAQRSHGFSSIYRPSRTSPAPTLNMHYEHADVREVLRALFRNKDVSYTIAPDVQGTVDLEAKDAQIDEVLQLIVKQIGGSFTVKNGIYEVSGKPKS